MVRRFSWKLGGHHGVTWNYIYWLHHYIRNYPAYIECGLLKVNSSAWIINQEFVNTCIYHGDSKRIEDSFVGYRNGITCKFLYLFHWIKGTRRYLPCSNSCLRARGLSRWWRTSSRHLLTTPSESWIRLSIVASVESRHWQRPVRFNRVPTWNIFTYCYIQIEIYFVKSIEQNNCCLGMGYPM